MSDYIYPWDEIGIALEPGTKTWLQVMDQAGLNWTVEPVYPQIYFNGSYREDQFRKYILHGETGKTLDVVKPNWSPLQNASLDFLDKVVELGAANYHTAGQFFEGGRVFVLLKVNYPPLEIFPGETVELFILVANAHKSGVGAHARLLLVKEPSRITIAVETPSVTSSLFKITHRGNQWDHRSKTLRLINSARSYLKDYGEKLKALVQPLPMPPGRFFSLVFNKVKSYDQGKKVAHIKRVTELFEYGLSVEVDGADDTLWAAVSAVCEFVDFVKSRDNETRLDESWYGRGYALKLRAFQVALSSLKR